MTLSDFISTYGGNNCISIEGYCSEIYKDDILKANFYNGIKDKTISWWQTIGGDSGYPVEVCIELDK